MNTTFEELAATIIVTALFFLWLFVPDGDDDDEDTSEVQPEELPSEAKSNKDAGEL